MAKIGFRLWFSDKILRLVTSDMPLCEIPPKTLSINHADKLINHFKKSSNTKMILSTDKLDVGIEICKHTHDEKKYPIKFSAQNINQDVTEFGQGLKKLLMRDHFTDIEIHNNNKVYMKGKILSTKIMFTTCFDKFSRSRDFYF